MELIFFVAIFDVSLLSILVYAAQLFRSYAPQKSVFLRRAATRPERGSDKPPYNPQKNRFLTTGAKSRKIRAAGVGDGKGNGNAATAA